MEQVSLLMVLVGTLQKSFGGEALTGAAGLECEAALQFDPLFQNSQCGPEPVSSSSV
jgi:hypothetical protein